MGEVLGLGALGAGGDLWGRYWGWRCNEGCEPLWGWGGDWSWGCVGFGGSVGGGEWVSGGAEGVGVGSQLGVQWGGEWVSGGQGVQWGLEAHMGLGDWSCGAGEGSMGEVLGLGMQ